MDWLPYVGAQATAESRASVLQVRGAVVVVRSHENSSELILGKGCEATEAAQGSGSVAPWDWEPGAGALDCFAATDSPC